jgi:2-polyprenyl-6-methoxyphenol hydroxylase-like FAD-dependent oxidoreductase
VIALQAGRCVLVLEKSLEQPDRIVGELLQPGGYLMLKRIGLADCTEGIDAQRVNGYAIIKDGRVACVKYPTEGFDEDVAGRSFHHGRCGTQTASTFTFLRRQCAHVSFASALGHVSYLS